MGRAMRRTNLVLQLLPPSPDSKFAVLMSSGRFELEGSSYEQSLAYYQRAGCVCNHLIDLRLHVKLICHQGTETE